MIVYINNTDRMCLLYMMCLCFQFRITDILASSIARRRNRIAGSTKKKFFLFTCPRMQNLEAENAQAPLRFCIRLVLFTCVLLFPWSVALIHHQVFT